MEQEVIEKSWLEEFKQNWQQIIRDYKKITRQSFFQRWIKEQFFIKKEPEVVVIIN